MNNLAFANLPAWVPKLFPGARPAGQLGYRVSSKELGRDLEEDLSITSQSAVDFGVADMGDAREGKSTPIDLVMEHLGASTVQDAALWLCDRLDMEPANLGWQDNEELTRFGAKIADRLENEGCALHDAPEGMLCETTTGASWASPDLSALNRSRRPPPEFLATWLGPILGPWATAQARAVCAPLDYVAVCLLALVGGLLGNRRRPLAGAGWSEPPTLFAALVGDPSSGKSPASSAVMALAEEAERRLAANYEKQHAEYETKMAVAEIAKERWKTLVRESLKGPLAHIPVPRPDEAADPVAPLLGRHLVNDATVEKLAIIAAGNPQGFILHRDELSGLLSSFGRYSGGGDGDRAFWLEAYGGRPVTVDRGAIQPDRLSGLLGSVDDGLVPRFLWCWPDPMPGFSISHERIYATPARRAITCITNLIMATMPAGASDIPVLVRLSEAALLRLEGFGRDVKVKEAGPAPTMKGVLGKARGHALRLSAILAFMQWTAGDKATAQPREIDEKAMATACSMVGSYFPPMAERVFGDASIPEVETDSALLARHLQKDNAATFNARAVRLKVGGKLRKAEDMDAACADLMEAGLIRPVAKGQKTPGRAPKDFEVNPALLKT